MGIAPDALAIGLTGPFGSGCTTAAKTLEERMHFRHVHLSDLLRKEWYRNHPRKRKAKTSIEPVRPDLQELGDRMRREARDPGVLVNRAITGLRAEPGSDKKLVFDAIRNVGEIDALRAIFGNRFFLFALQCKTSDRWERVAPTYEAQGRGIDDFTNDNERDRDEEDIYGQQVDLCLDRADVLLKNDNDVNPAKLRQNIAAYLKLVTGEHPRYATPIEIYMNLAYSAAHGSKCLKRQVGAVLVDAQPGQRGPVIAQGFNENPFATHPCVEEPLYGADAAKGKRGNCHRDIVRHKSYVDGVHAGVHCPQCGIKLPKPKKLTPPWRCPSCRVNIEKFFWPDRAMSLCTAIHAEAAAILAAGAQAKGATLYTTTFPCFQCAEKIIQAGILNIVFTEPYPDIRAAERLELAKIEPIGFEGVRSSRFDEIFSPARLRTDEEQEARSI